jgi:hypothetical protein
MRRSDHPNRPSAMTCCFFSSFKTLLTLTEGNPHVRINVLDRSSLAGFQVTFVGRFWMITEGSREFEQESRPGWLRGIAPFSYPVLTASMRERRRKTT